MYESSPLRFIPVIYIQPDVGHVWFCQYALVLAPGKHVNPIAVSTSRPNCVLLEESEPNISFIALTLPYTVLIKFAQVNTSCYYKQNTGITLVMASI